MNQDLETIAVTDEIGGQLETLMAEIQNKLSGAALNFYKREFDFFFQITDISRIIKWGQVEWKICCVIWTFYGGNAILTCKKK